jgi:type II secretory pathway pseudopilin PulG
MAVAGPALTQQGILIKPTTIHDEQVYQALSTKQPLPIAPSWCLAKDRLIIALSPQMISSMLSRPSDFKALSKMPAVAREFSGSSPPMALVFDETKSGLQGLYALAQFGMPMLSGELAKQGITQDLPMLPTFGVVAKHALPRVATIRRTKDGLMAEQHSSIPLPSLDAGGGASAGVLVSLLLPAVQASRAAALRNNAMNQMKMLAIAMHNYNHNNQRFPGAASYDASKKPLLSWRVELLPYLEERKLYDQFHRDEPWDSDHNKKLIEKMPAVFADPSLDGGIVRQGKTTFVAPTGKETLFDSQEGPKLPSITDGLSNTIMIVEASPDRAVIWTKPDDIEIDGQNPQAGLGGAHVGVFLAAFADGSVRGLSFDIDPTLLKSLFTPHGGEVVQTPN